MSLEFILWIVAFFVVWEIIYLFFTLILYKKMGWLEKKISSGGWAILFIFIQAIIVFANEIPFTLSPHYDRLLWEGGIIVFLILFFLLNKWIDTKFR